jgi:hypothetical protein
MGSLTTTYSVADSDGNLHTTNTVTTTSQDVDSTIGPGDPNYTAVTGIPNPSSDTGLLGNLLPSGWPDPTAPLVNGFNSLEQSLANISTPLIIVGCVVGGLVVLAVGAYALNAFSRARGS